MVGDDVLGDAVGVFVDAFVGAIVGGARQRFVSTSRVVIVGHVQVGFCLESMVSAQVSSHLHDASVVDMAKHFPPDPQFTDKQGFNTGLLAQSPSPPQ